MAIVPWAGWGHGGRGQGHWGDGGSQPGKGQGKKSKGKCEVIRWEGKQLDFGPAPLNVAVVSGDRVLGS